MMILGKEERLKFDADRNHYAKEVQKIYDEANTYHDGKWRMFEPTDTTLFDDSIRLLFEKESQIVRYVISNNEIRVCEGA